MIGSYRCLKNVYHQNKINPPNPQVRPGSGKELRGFAMKDCVPSISEDCHASLQLFYCPGSRETKDAYTSSLQMHILVINRTSPGFRVYLIWAILVECSQHLVIVWCLYRPVALIPMGPLLASGTELLFSPKWLHSFLVVGPSHRGCRTV